MARLYGELRKEGGKTTTRCAHNKLICHLRGWNKGIKVVASYNGQQDSFDIYETGGSNNPSEEILILKTIDEYGQN